MDEIRELQSAMVLSLAATRVVELEGRVFYKDTNEECKRTIYVKLAGNKFKTGVGLARVIWYQHYGVVPGSIKHLNRDIRDFRIENLVETKPSHKGNTTKMLRLNMLFLAFTLLCSSAYAANYNPEAATVRVYHVVPGNGTSKGTGTVVGVNGQQQSGLIATCAHIFSDGKGRTTVKLSDGSTRQAVIVKMNRTADLAALRIERPSVPGVRINYTVYKERFSACGLGKLGIYQCATGDYVGTSGTRLKGRSDILTEGSIRKGDSGCGLFNSTGELVAVAWGRRSGNTYSSSGVELAKFFKPLFRRNRGGGNRINVGSNNNNGGPGGCEDCEPQDNYDNNTQQDNYDNNTQVGYANPPVYETPSVQGPKPVFNVPNNAVPNPIVRVPVGQPNVNVVAGKPNVIVANPTIIRRRCDGSKGNAAKIEALKAKVAEVGAQIDSNTAAIAGIAVDSSANAVAHLDNTEAIELNTENIEALNGAMMSMATQIENVAKEEGPIGETGKQGETGEAGHDGHDGRDGHAGSTGEVGAMGVAGKDASSQDQVLPLVLSSSALGAVLMLGLSVLSLRKVKP